MEPISIQENILTSFFLAIGKESFRLYVNKQECLESLSQSEYPIIVNLICSPENYRYGNCCLQSLPVENFYYNNEYITVDRNVIKKVLNVELKQILQDILHFSQTIGTVEVSQPHVFINCTIDNILRGDNLVLQNCKVDMIYGDVTIKQIKNSSIEDISGCAHIYKAEHCIIDTISCKAIIDKIFDSEIQKAIGCSKVISCKNTIIHHVEYPAKVPEIHTKTILPMSR